MARTVFLLRVGGGFIRVTGESFPSILYSLRLKSFDLMTLRFFVGAASCPEGEPVAAGCRSYSNAPFNARQIRASPHGIGAGDELKKLSASILSADFGRLAAEVQAVEEAGADWIHVDVMDGRFVPNITIGPDVVRAIRRATTLPLDVHLMIADPDRYLEAFADAGADWLGVHVEASLHLHRTIQRMRELQVNPSVSLNPATPLTSIGYILEDVDMVLLMTVNPGFGGQRFIPGVIPKILQLRKTIDENNLSVVLEVDGGVNTRTIASLVTAGVDVFVAGSAVFGGGDYAGNVRALKDLMKTPSTS
jgi:ribulose-phosphate 3-epimerase